MEQHLVALVLKENQLAFLLSQLYFSLFDMPIGYRFPMITKKQVQFLIFYLVVCEEEE